VASFTLLNFRGGPARHASNQSRRWILAGFFAAMALGTKYSVIWPVIGLLLVLGVRRPSLRVVGSFALSVVVFSIPSLLSNLILTGNPTYPFFFEGAMWDGHRAEWFSRFGTGLDLPSVLLAPWEATVFGIEGGFFEGHASFGATVGPLLLALAPMALLRLGRHRRQTRALLIVIAVAGFGWFVQLASSQLLVQTRLLFPVFPFLSALAAIGFDSVGDLSKRLRFVLGGLLAFVLAATSVGYLVETVQSRAGRVALGFVSDSQYLEVELGSHAQAMAEINELPVGSKVYFLWEPRSYYCYESITCEPDAVLDRWWHARQHASQASEILSEWKSEGASHVLYRQIGAHAVRAAGFDPLKSADWAELELLLEELLIPLNDTVNEFVLYEIP
jgi:hypothetical protein